MEVKLLVVGGKRPGQEIPVPGPEFFIGRAEDCQLRPRSDQVSRRHCVILVEEGSVVVRDFGSTNGTFVNDEKVNDKRELKTGDRLKVGPLEFEVRLDVPVGGKKKPKVRSIQEAAARTVAKSVSKEMDVANWLEEDENAPSSPPPPAEENPSEQQEQPAKVVGRFQSGGKNMAESSRDAADDMLRQMFRRP